MNSKRKKKDVKEYNNFKIFLIKFFIIVLMFSLFTVASQNDNKIKNTIYNKVYNNSFSFAYFKNIYNKYIGNIIPFQNIFKEKKVFLETLEYESLSKYNNGVKLTLSSNYAIPIIKEGIVIFIGDKENIGKTVIIQGTDGVDIWYGNLQNTNFKLYDYVEDNMIIGEAKDNTLYMIFQKDGVELDYKEFLK